MFHKGPCVRGLVLNLALSGSGRVLGVARECHSVGDHFSCMHRAPGSTSSTTLFLKPDRFCYCSFLVCMCVPWHPRRSEDNPGYQLASCPVWGRAFVVHYSVDPRAPREIYHHWLSHTDAPGWQVSNSASSFWGSRDPNSSLHLCSASTWSTKPSPSPHWEVLEKPGACPSLTLQPGGKHPNCERWGHKAPTMLLLPRGLKLQSQLTEQKFQTESKPAPPLCQLMVSGIALQLHKANETANIGMPWLKNYSILGSITQVYKEFWTRKLFATLLTV